MSQKFGLVNGMLISLLISVLKAGNATWTNNTQKNAAIVVTNTDSTRNCRIKDFLCDPIAFLIPTSLALFSDLAVVRLIKLMHAISSTNTPIIVNICTYSIKPAESFPFSYFE